MGENLKILFHSLLSGTVRSQDVAASLVSGVSDVALSLGVCAAMNQETTPKTP
jgi:hypothetical protein